MAVASICIFVILPLTLVGTVLGRNLAGTPDYPCRVNAVPRPIPEKKWFMEPMVIVMLGGILPFGSIFRSSRFKQKQGHSSFLHHMDFESDLVKTKCGPSLLHAAAHSETLRCRPTKCL